MNAAGPKRLDRRPSPRGRRRRPNSPRAGGGRECLEKELADVQPARAGEVGRSRICRSGSRRPRSRAAEAPAGLAAASERAGGSRKSWRMFGRRARRTRGWLRSTGASSLPGRRSCSNAPRAPNAATSSCSPPAPSARSGWPRARRPAFRWRPRPRPSSSRAPPRSPGCARAPKGSAGRSNPCGLSRRRRRRRPKRPFAVPSFSARELAESRDRVRELAAECDRLTGELRGARARARGGSPDLARQGGGRGARDPAAPGAGGGARQPRRR